MMNFKILLFTTILLFCFVAVSAQRKAEADVFADIPADTRARLIERFETFIRYYREQDKNKIYDFLGEQAKRSYVGGLSRESFLKDSYLLKLKKFEVESVGVPIEQQNEQVKYLLIYGCGEYKRFGPNKKLQSRLEAYYQDSDWYFSEIETPHPLHGEPKSCR